ncbi:CrcB family protein [Viridibacillus sp. YIM B01967]|uniref:Fluoride-specific ion channel FluC n=1 Tax=Viridibacillus soli TaxID=2798301 RepID=A0ABS1H5H2_9BACL|nr:CrcB family protein [Viridibacillus soli]MBK3494556.1 CrcB family protein [Viridibacillus soli]
MIEIIIVGIGGIMGALLRYGVIMTVPTEWMLWVVNGAGSAALGVLNGLFARYKTANSWRLLLTTGLLGAFTTFSTFSASWFALMQTNVLMAILYAVMMTVVCVALASFGYLCTVPKAKIGERS